MFERSRRCMIRRYELVKILQSTGIMKSEQLREFLGISQRTLMRDLKALRVLGIEIDSSRGRGGGLRINKSQCIKLITNSTE